MTITNVNIQLKDGLSSHPVDLLYASKRKGSYNFSQKSSGLAKFSAKIINNIELIRKLIAKINFESGKISSKFDIS